MDALPRQISGLDALRRDNPWPEPAAEPREPFLLALDGGGTGGRELIVEALRAHRVTLMVEVGCFLCGSVRQWLEAVDDLTVIGIDPWEGSWDVYIRRLRTAEHLRRTVAHFSNDEIDRICEVLRDDGNYRVALNNVGMFRDRFIPVRRRAPEALAYLRRHRISPQLIYIDADKKRDSLDAAHAQFPDAILCGDDWLWPNEDGVLEMQEHVKAFAAEHGFEIQHRRQTWLLVPPGAARVELAVEAAPATAHSGSGSPNKMLTDKKKRDRNVTAGQPIPTTEAIEARLAAQGYFLSEMIASFLNAYGVTETNFEQRLGKMREAMLSLNGHDKGEAPTPRLRVMLDELDELGSTVVSRLAEKRQG